MAYFYQTITLKDEPSLKAVVLAAFPSYRKLKASVQLFNGGTNINSYWDGGSKSEYAIVHIPTLRRMPLPSSSHPYFDVAAHGGANTENEAISIDRVGNITLKVLPPDCCLVECGTFCGKPATAHLYIQAANMPARLTAGSEAVNVS